MVSFGELLNEMSGKKSSVVGAQIWPGEQPLERRADLLRLLRAISQNEGETRPDS
jgi:hypothetical protein